MQKTEKIFGRAQLGSLPTRTLSLAGPVSEGPPHDMAQPVPLRVSRARAHCVGAPVDRHGAPVDGGIVVVVISKVVPYKASKHAVRAAAQDQNVPILAC